MDFVKETEVTLLRDHPELLRRAADWFSARWEIPAEAYYESMRECARRPGGVPQWYIATDARGEIMAGAGIIENDFHDRKDLTPNLCALFVEENYRGLGLARRLLDFARDDMGQFGFPTLYLVTDHTEFYEKCGWEFLTTVIGDDQEPMRMYAAPGPSRKRRK